MSANFWLETICEFIALGYLVVGMFFIRKDKHMVDLFFKMMDTGSAWPWVLFWVIYMLWPLKVLWNLLVWVINKCQGKPQ